MDISVFCREQGSGFPVILLHGNGESGALFSRQMEPFSAHFHVYAPDTRGHGETPMGDRPFTISQFADDLEDFCRERSIDRAHIVGFSDGGNIALLFALRHPERIEKLVLSGANLNPLGVKLPFQLSIVRDYVRLCLKSRRTAEEEHARLLLRLMVLEPHIAPRSLASVRIPTLVLAGTEDLIRQSHTRRIARSIPGAQLRILPGPHDLAVQEADAFNRAVLDFLRSGKQF